MKVLILVIFCLLLANIHTLTVGSCQQFSLDGQTCLKCVDHFHLYEGTCYVDILGCQEYIFGNICHSCANEYILVNNLCCDHNCLSKLFKRHESSKAIKTINQNTKTFMKIIPFLNQNYIKGAIQNLVQIQFQDYIDVVRYVLLYEFPSGKFRMRRAVIDYAKDTQQLIIVDWSIVQDVSQFMNFHKDQIQLQFDEQANKVIAKLFVQKPLISHIRKFKLTEIDQYQIVFNNLDKEQIIYQTFYLKDSKTIHLFTQFSVMPEFMPTQLTIYAADLASQININNSLKQAVRIVKLDSRYKDDIHHIIIKQNNRFVIQYMIHIQNSKEEMQFFLFENLKANEIKIIDYIRKQKEVLKPIVNNIVQNINVTEWNNTSQADGKTINNLSLSENKIVEILKNAVINIQNQKKQQKSLSQYVKTHFHQQDKSDSQIQTEQISIVRLFRQKNPQLISFELVQTWQHKFKTFKQWTLLVKNQTEKKINYIYFHALQFLQNNTYTFWGQSSTTLLQINREGLYQLINKQENVPQSKVKDARSVIKNKYPQTQSLTARKNILRTFAQKNRRFTILLRHETSLVKYVVLSDSSKTWIQQSQIVEDNLQKLNQNDQTLIQVKNKLQVMIDEVYCGKQIDPQVNLAKVDPIILRQINKEQQNIKSKAKEDSKNMQIVDKIRQHNKDLKNFQIVQTWTSKVSDQKERQTILLKQTGNKEGNNTEQVYQYHTLVKNVQTDQIMYIGHQTMEAVVEDQKGKAIQPPTIIDLAQEKTKPKQITTIWQKTMKQIKQQIIVKVVQTKDIQQVTKKMPNRIQRQIYKWTPQLSQWQTKKFWNNNNLFKTYIQYTGLFQKGSSYIYVYLFQWKKNKTFSFVGNYTVKKPIINKKGQFVNPNVQSRFKNNKTAFLTNVIVKEFPQVVSHQIVIIQYRIFPSVTRYTVVLKSGRKKLQYIIHLYGQNAIIVQWQILEQNLAPISKQVKVIQELVIKTLQNVKQINQQQKRLIDCKDRECNETQLVIQKQQLAILKLFRQKNPTLTSLQLIQTWTHQFKTFVQWTILVKITSMNKTSFIYFHANQFLQNNNFTFWGQTILLQPLVGDNGKYGLSNPQQNAPQSKLLEARTIINLNFPQVTALQARQTILRQFPEKRIRSLIVLRHETSKVEYIVLSDSKRSWLQESSTIETNLQKQISSLTELKRKLQVLATQISSKKPINTQASQKISQQQIQIIPKKVATEPISSNIVKGINQQFKRQDTVISAVSGKTTQNINTMTKNDQQFVNKIAKIYRNNNNFTSQQFQTITSVQPFTVIHQQFCQFSDYLLIYELQQRVCIFAFRFYMAKEDDIEYLGKFIFNRIGSMSDQDIIDKSTALRYSFDKDTAINTIILMHKDLTGLTYQKMDIKQMGDYIRAVFIYPTKDYLSRYLVSVSPNGDYKIIQECKLPKSKQLHTLTKVSITGQTSVYTNDVQNILKEDKTANEVIQNLKREISNVKDGQVVDIKVTDYDKKTQYVVNFKTDKPDISQTHHEVSVVHDKTSHSNDIIGVQVVKPQQIKPVQTETSQATKPTTTKTIESPMETHQTYIVIGGSKLTPSGPTSTQTISKVQNPLNAEVSSKIIQQIKNSQNIKQQDIEVKQILVKAHTEDKKVNKIQQIVQNNKSGQQLMVTAIVNTQTNKVIVEDIKPIQDHIAKHLQLTHKIQPQLQPQIKQLIKIKPQQVFSILRDVQTQIIKRQEQNKASDKIIEDIQQIEKLENQIRYKPEQNHYEPILINPSDIQSVLQQVKDRITVIDTAKVTQRFTPAVTQTKQQALNYLQTAKPQTSTAKVVQTITQVLPTSVITHIIEQTPLNTIYATIHKTQAGNNLTDFITVKNTNQKTIQTVISQVQSQDTAGYQPIDPQIMNMGKVTQIIASQPNSQFEQKIDLTKPEEKIEQVVQAIRTQYPVTNQATVIAASQTKISQTNSEVKVDFFVPSQNNAYKLNEAKVQISTANNNNDPSYAVTSFSQVINNGVQTNKVLDKADPAQLPNIINLAYGFQKIDLAVAAKNLDIQTIQAEIQRRYANFVGGQTVTQIQSLELKNGKVNYVFRYKNAYFTIYWDSILQRIIFLNQVSTTSRTQFQAVKDMEYYTNGLSYVANIHQNQMKSYKTLTTGEYINGLNILFQIEFLSGNRKYRSIFQVNKQTMDTTELLFIQLIELTMKDYSLKEIKLLADIYQRIIPSSYKSNRYFTMVDQYAKNRNQILKNSKILGASFKSQNLGFNFKITYKTEDSSLIQVQIYIETFSQRYSQISLKLLDFENGFSSAQVSKVDMDKIIQYIASKNSIVLTKDQQNIDNAQAKQFFYGYLFKLIVTISSIQYEGLVYVDSASGQISLIRWRTKFSGTGCQIKAEESQECKKCSNSYVLSEDMKTCLRQIDGCQIYGDNKLTCNICKTGFEKLNKICTKDCGLLCLAVAYP